CRLVGAHRVRFEIVPDVDHRALSALEPAEQLDARVAQDAQVDVAPAGNTGLLWWTGEAERVAKPGDRVVEHAHVGAPADVVLAAIAPRDPATATGRLPYLSAGLVQV